MPKTGLVSTGRLGRYYVIEIQGLCERIGFCFAESRAKVEWRGPDSISWDSRCASHCAGGGPSTMPPPV